MTSVTEAVAPDQTDAEGTQDAPVTAPQVDVDALVAKAGQLDAYAAAFMGLIRESFANYQQLDKQYKQLKAKGETSLVELLAGVTDDDNAQRLAEGIKAIEAKLIEVKAKARELLNSKGMVSDAEEAELKEKRDSARTQVNKTNDLLASYIESKPALAELKPFTEQFKTRQVSTPSVSAEENEKIRAWAKANNVLSDAGKPVAEKGRIAADVVEKYRAAHPA